VVDVDQDHVVARRDGRGRGVELPYTSPWRTSEAWIARELGRERQAALVEPRDHGREELHHLEARDRAATRAHACAV
jgi:hypothetical protein